MKKFLFLVLIFFSVLSFAQDKKEVEKQFMNYSQLIMDHQFEQAIDQYAPDGMLKLVKKEDLVKMMESLINSPQFELKLYEPEAIKVGKIKKIKGKHYANLNYVQKLNMKFKDEIDRNLLLGLLTIEFGDQNVKLDEATGFFKIKSQKDCIAISDNQNDWKFAVVEKASSSLLTTFLPEEILEKYQIK